MATLNLVSFTIMKTIRKAGPADTHLYLDRSLMESSEPACHQVVPARTKRSRRQSYGRTSRPSATWGLQRGSLKAAREKRTKYKKERPITTKHPEIEQSLLRRLGPMERYFRGSLRWYRTRQLSVQVPSNARGMKAPSGSPAQVRRGTSCVPGASSPPLGMQPTALLLAGRQRFPHRHRSTLTNARPIGWPARGGSEQYLHGAGPLFVVNRGGRAVRARSRVVGGRAPPPPAATCPPRRARRNFQPGGR